MIRKQLLLAAAFACLAALALLVFAAPVARAAGGPVVISQFYGGGGNSGAVVTHDFIELFNPGTQPVSLRGWSVQYTSATGTAAWQVTVITGTIAPGQYILVREAVGSGCGGQPCGAPLPAPDFTGTIAMSGTGGKLALVQGTTALVGGCPSANVVDMVGFGPSATCFAGAPTAATTNSTGGLRKLNGCTNAGNNSTDFALVAPSPRNSASPKSACGIGLNKTAPAAVGAGDVLMYTLTATNKSYPNADLTDLVITDTVPSNASFVPDSASDGGVLDAGNVVAWTVPVVSFGETVTRTFAITAPLTNGATVVNNDYAAHASNWLTPTLGAAVSTNVGSPDLQLSKVGPAGPLTPGATVAFTLSYTNAGAVDASQVQLVDTLPNGLSFDSATGGGTDNSGTVTWNLGTLAPGASGSVTVSAIAQYGGTYTNTATISSSGIDENPVDNSAEFTVTVTGPDVFVAKTGPASLIAGDVVTYTITYGNQGSLPADGVQLVDTLPGPILTTDIVTDTSGLPYADGTAQRTWTIGTLPAGSQHSFELAVRVPAGTASNTAVTNQVDISTSSEGNAPDNDSAVANGTVYQVLTIGAIQGAGTASSYAGQTIVTRGVIYAKIWYGGVGSTTYGLFIESKAGTGDGDPNTSDGIFVFLNRNQNIGGYTPKVGDEILLQGKVSEYNGLTELSSPLAVLDNLGPVGDLNAAVPPVEMVPQGTDAANATAYEKLESMRVMVPAGSQVVAPKHYYSSSNDSEMYLVRGDSPVVTGYSNPFERRVYRDQNPDQAPYMISVEANVMKAAAGDYLVQLPDANTYDVLAGDAVGPLYYAYSKFTFEPEAAPVLSATVNAFDNFRPQPAYERQQYRIETTNTENLYDYLNDPNSGCDFVGDPGCPGVTPPFDYPAASAAAYRTKIEKLANQVISGTLTPDIIALQEVENQDICTGGGELYGQCSTTGQGNPDGKLDALADLAQQIYINTSHVISYSVASDRTGGDYRGIIVGFLYRNDRVELAPVSALHDDPVLGVRPTDPYSNTYPHNTQVLNPKALQGVFNGGGLFERMPQAALFRVHRTNVNDPNYVEVYAIGNHFKSGPDTNIDLRTGQANYNGQLVKDILAAKPNARVTVLGDLNVYPDSTQLQGLYNAPLHNTYYDIPLASRYSYTYNGVTQTLDQIFVSGMLTRTLETVAVAHINADWSYGYEDTSAVLYHDSDHDPIVATFRFAANEIALPQVFRSYTPR